MLFAAFATRGVCADYKNVARPIFDTVSSIIDGCRSWEQWSDNFLEDGGDLVENGAKKNEG